MKGGFADSPLRMNQGLAKLEHWTEDAIKSRAATLAGRAVDVWGAPSLPADVLDACKPKTGASRYIIEGHPHLSAGSDARAIDGVPDPGVGPSIRV